MQARISGGPAIGESLNQIAAVRTAMSYGGLFLRRAWGARGSDERAREDAIVAELLVVGLCVPLISGLLAARIAGGEGRNPTLWFVIGAIIPIVAVAITYLVARRGRTS